MIRIVHTREHGTIVHGTSRGDGTNQHLKAAGFRFSRNLPDGAGWYIASSRAKRADEWRINQAVEALRAAGFEVETEIDNATPTATSFAEREAESYDRAEERVDRYAERASAAAGRGKAILDSVDEWRSQIPLGQPILVGHHSERRDRNQRERMHRREGRGYDELKKGAYWAGRAEAADGYKASRENVETTLRRVDRLEARKRKIERELAGRADWLLVGDAYDHIARQAEQGVTVKEVRRRGERVLVLTPPSPARRAELNTDLGELDEEIVYWRRHLAEREAEGHKIWSRADFTKGDFVKCHGTWFEVVRVNAKSVSIPGVVLGVGRQVYTKADMGDRGWTDTLPYHRVQGRMSAAEAREKGLIESPGKGA